jgi:hypothetical protein
VAAQISLSPIIDGASAFWRGFVAELQGARRIEWAQSQRRRGITREVIAVAAGTPEMVVVYTESADHARAAALLAESGDLFDQWYRTRLAELLDDAVDTEVVFDSAPKPGPWRGWR